ncbi:DnaJ domain-containing protein [Anaerosphaera aminiphila DSM 21120]|uniref:DnaJ domain-containing protein n=1 Tax=Anaerosphaera aminiphila DSM 21120 TaxID=1120995 RepID=A0A1M5PFJ9_9FIRM|nr:J domain-containing protein [Anaerosphaera aminiphila]SHH00520.1 DnaJ domain-containing protein [Anaerosphaera aminiphila DSM 21120]
MNIWEILEIEPTENKKEIKKAYAKKLKVTHPDDDLEKFQELKEAFDLALNYRSSGEEGKSKNLKDSISKEFTDIISIEYWGNYYNKWENTEDAKNNLEMFILENVGNIPKDIINFVLEKFELFIEDELALKSFKNIPDFKVYAIDGLNNDENIKFYRVRYAIFYKLTTGFNNIEELGELFNIGENLNSKDEDLKFLKLSFGIVQDIELKHYNPLALNNTKINLSMLENTESKTYNFVKNFIEVYSKERLNLSDDFLKFQDVKYIPEYLILFLKGYASYVLENYNGAYYYWFVEKNILPKILQEIAVREISLKESYLNAEFQESFSLENKKSEDVSLDINDLFSNLDMSQNLDNWKNVLEDLSIEGYVNIQENIISFLVHNYKLLPKDVVDYIYKKFNIDDLENYKISNKLKTELKSLPNMNFKNNLIPKYMRAEFFETRYDYYFSSVRKEEGQFGNNLYNKLNSISFDYDVELIRVQQLFLEELALNKKNTMGFKDTKDQLRKLNVFQPTDTFNFYSIFFKIYDVKKINYEDFNLLLSYKKERLLIYEDIYNVILSLAFKFSKDSESSKKYRDKLPNYLMGYIDFQLKQIEKMQKRQNRTFKYIAKKIILSVSVVISAIVILALVSSYISDKTIDKRLENNYASNEMLTESELEYMGKYSTKDEVFAMRFLIEDVNIELNKKFAETYFSDEAKKIYEKNIIEQRGNKKLSLFNLKIITKYIEGRENLYTGYFYNSKLICLVEKKDDIILKIYGDGWSEILEEDEEFYSKIMLSNLLNSIKFVVSKYFVEDDKTSALIDSEYLVSEEFKTHIFEEPYNEVNYNYKMGFYLHYYDYDKDKEYIILYSNDKEDVRYIELDKFKRINKIFKEDSELVDEKLREATRDLEDDKRPIRV